MYLSPPVPIRVLHVDDDSAVADVTAAMLEREDERFVVDTATSVAAGLDSLSREEYDCVVSDYDMPERNGLDFLEDVHRRFTDVPFILFTGKGSEEIASEAISMGVSDYLQKKSGTEQYELLANRIRTHVERTRTRRELEERESHLRQAQLIADIGSWHLDVRAGELYWSDEIFEIFGIDGAADGIDYDQFLQHVHPADREDVDEHWNAALDGEEYDLEHRIVTGDGGTRWVRERAALVFDDDGDPLEALGIVQDITDRKEREQKLSALFDNASAAIAYTEFEDGDPIVGDVNEAFSRTFGCDPDAAVGQTLDDIVVPPDCREEATDINRRVLAGEQFEIGVRRETPDGLRDFLLHSVPLHPDESGEQSYAIYNDVTERKEYERRLKRQNARLDEFASIVSHDLRNPLSVAAGYLELAREECPSDHLEQVASALERSQTLVDDLLALAREDVNEMEAITLSSLVETCWRDVSTAGATLVVDSDATIRGDEGHLRQLVENLLRNSVEHGSTGSRSETDDAVEHGSTSSPDASRSDEDVTVTVGSLDDGFYVADDGPGLDGDWRERAFESGFSTSDDGVGVGLSIVEQVVEAHGWDVDVCESDGGGARFEITGVEFADR